VLSFFRHSCNLHFFWGLFFCVIFFFVCFSNFCILVIISFPSSFVLSNLWLDVFCFKFFYIFVLGLFLFNSWLSFTTSFDLFLFKKTFLIFLLLPFVLPSFVFYFSLLISLLLSLHFIFLFLYLQFISAWRYFVILVSCVFVFSSWFLCWVVCYSNDLSEFVLLFISLPSCFVLLFLTKIWNICRKTGLQEKNVKHSKNRPPNGVPRTGGQKS
jgi:hypothetical protein